MDFQNGNKNLHTDWTKPHTVLKRKTDGVNSGYCRLFLLKLVQLPAYHWKYINSPTTFSYICFTFHPPYQKPFRTDCTTHHTFCPPPKPSKQTAVLTTRFVLLVQEALGTDALLSAGLSHALHVNVRAVRGWLATLGRTSTNTAGLQIGVAGPRQDLNKHSRATDRGGWPPAGPQQTPQDYYR